MSKPTEIEARLASPGAWGEWGKADEHLRYMGPITKQPNGRGRRRCWCGCGKWRTHVGYANGLAMTGGCEWAVRQWVRDCNWRPPEPPPIPNCPCGQPIRTERGMAAHVLGWRHTRWTERQRARSR